MTKSSEKSETNGNKSSFNSYVINFSLFLLAILIGILMQQAKMVPNIVEQMVKGQVTQQTAEVLDKEAIYNELTEKIKRELLHDTVMQEKIAKTWLLNEKMQEKKQPKQTQDEIVNKQKEELKEEVQVVRPKSETLKTKEEPKKSKVVVDDSKLDDGQAIKIDPKTSQLEIDSKKIKIAQEEKKDSTPKVTKPPAKAKLTKSEPDLPDEVKNFQSTMINKMKPKKMWIPIPNSNGGHRRVPAMEITPGNQHGSSVKVWLYEEFLSKEECEQLIQAHETHLKQTLKQRPIICFDSISTLRKNLESINRTQFAERVTPNDFTDGTMCLNQTFSRQLEKWGLKWSFSTVFYPGESKFSTVLGKRIEEATQLQDTHGGKFQITSYPYEVGYKEHHDCLVDSNDEHDRYATFLTYLNDFGGADGGGTTTFTEMEIDVKPREGRSLVWNNMDYETGKCEPMSKHRASIITHVTKKKYIIQRWYYYKNFYSLGKRMQEPKLPERPAGTPLVSCDNFDEGSCRLYDEWGPDHILEYRNKKSRLNY